MKKYVVWSQDPEKVDADGNPLVIRELSRTDKGVAYSDVAIVREILGRKAWVQEMDEAG